MSMVYGMHNWPELPIGSIGVNSGPMMAAVDEFDIIVKGKLGELTETFNSQRYGIAIVLLLFVTGFILLQSVDEKKGMKIANKE